MVSGVDLSKKPHNSKGYYNLRPISIGSNDNVDTIYLSRVYGKSYILSVGLLLCGLLFVRPLCDSYLMPRHIIWCITAILLCWKGVSKPTLPMVVYLTCAIMSGLVAVNTAEWMYSVSRLLLVLAFICAVEVDIKIIARTMMVLGIIFSLVFWIEYLMNGNLQQSWLMGQRNYLAASHLLVIPFCFLGQWKRLGLCLAIVLTVDIFISGSKGSVLALLIGMSLINKRVFVICLIASIVLCVVRFSTIPFSVTGRLVQWQATLGVIIDNPLGIGAGNFIVQFPNYARGMNYCGAFDSVGFRFPHNDYLWICAEVGIVGIIAWLGVIISAMKSATKPLLIGMVGYIAVSMFTSLHERAFPSMVFAVMIALSLPHTKSVNGKYIIICLLGILVIFGFRLKSDYYFKKLASTQNVDYAIKAESPFSTLSYCGIPYRSWIYIDTKKFDDATKAYTLNPYNIQTLNMMGSALEREGLQDEAKWCYLEALDICPDYEDAQTNLKRLKDGN